MKIRRKPSGRPVLPKRYRRIAELQTVAISERNKVVEIIQGILDSSSQPTALIDEQGIVVAFNSSGARQLGYELSDMLGRCIYDFFPSSVRESRRFRFEEVFRRGVPELFEDQREGRWLEISLHPVKDGSGRTTRILIHGNDISERKRLEEQLRKSHDELEQRVSERTAELLKSKEELETKSTHLQEANIALKVLLQQIGEDKKDLEDRFASNIKRLVLPYVNKIKKGKLDPRQTACINIIEANLNEIVSPLLQNLSQFGLTPRENQIAALIKDGKTSKEIAEIIGVAPSAIDSYRNKIRRKLKLNNKKINLQTHLQSIKH